MFCLRSLKVTNKCDLFLDFGLLKIILMMYLKVLLLEGCSESFRSFLSETFMYIERRRFKIAILCLGQICI